jgi:hypothetical protein
MFSIREVLLRGAAALTLVSVDPPTLTKIDPLNG